MGGISSHETIAEFPNTPAYVLQITAAIFHGVAKLCREKGESRRANNYACNASFLDALVRERAPRVGPPALSAFASPNGGEGAA